MRLLLWACVLLIAALIFAFSAQDGQASSETSDRVVRVVVRVTHPEFNTLPTARQRSLWNSISFYVRKSAHFLEYTALGFFLHLLTRSMNWRPAGLWAWLSGTLYAATDELHQYLSGARSGMWQDVALDSAGVLFGALAALALLALAVRLSRRKATS